MKILIQHGYESSLEMLSISRKLHKAIGEKYGFEVKENNEKIFKPSFVHFEKWRVMLNYISSIDDNSLLISLDSDVVVVGDLTDSIPESVDIGVTCYLNSHYNSGAIYWRANNKTRKLIFEMAKFPEKQIFKRRNKFNDIKRYVPDELLFNKLLGKSDLSILKLSQKWNSPNENIDDLRVMAYHGLPDSETKVKMKILVEKLTANDHPQKDIAF